jgi:bifunctional ADP-heptose synthase (sugar kinase/adenylyltransferase)
VGREIVEAKGGRVELVPPLEGVSTTGTIEKIRST